MIAKNAGDRGDWVTMKYHTKCAFEQMDILAKYADSIGDTELLVRAVATMREFNNILEFAQTQTRDGHDY